MSTVMIGLAFLFFFAHGLNWLFHRTKVPDLLILVILGYFIGPILGIVNASDFGKMGAVLSTLALAVILYEGGLHLNAKDLISSSLPAALISFLGFFLILLLGFLAAFFLAQQSLYISLLMGTAIGSTSSAIVLPMLKPLSLKDSTKTLLSLESAFTDVLTIVIFLVLLKSAVSNQFSLMGILVGVGPKTFVALGMGFCSGCLWAWIKKNFPEVVDMAFAGEAWAILTYGLIEISNHSGAIGVLALGFVLANLNLFPPWFSQFAKKNPVSEHEISTLREVSFLLRTFFFIYLGLLIQFSSTTVVLLAFFLSVCIFLTRYSSVRWLFKPDKFSRHEAMAITSMGPRGLACAVLATLPLQAGLEGGEWLRNILFALIPMSIFFTALFVALCESPLVRDKMGILFSSYKEEKGVEEKNH